MNLLRTLRMGALLLLTGLTVSSCLEPPDYSDTPSIGFKSISSERISDANGVYDRVTIVVSYRDGDGDLGLNNEDKVDGSPWARLNPDKTPNPYYNNYYLTPFIRNPQSNEFVELELPDPNFNYNSTYPRLSSDDRSAPLRGDLKFSYDFFQGNPFSRGQVVRFNVSIFDRALNQSNTVTTDPITIP